MYVRPIPPPTFDPQWRGEEADFPFGLVPTWSLGSLVKDINPIGGSEMHFWSIFDGMFLIVAVNSVYMCVQMHCISLRLMEQSGKEDYGGLTVPILVLQC